MAMLLLSTGIVCAPLRARVIASLLMIVLLSGCMQSMHDTGYPQDITNLFSSTRIATDKLEITGMLDSVGNEDYRHPPERGGFGETGVTYLYRASIPARMGNGGNRVLEVAYPLFDKVDVWIRQQDRQVKYYRSGSLRPFVERPIADPDVAFPLAASEGDTEVIIAISTTTPLTFSVLLWTQEAWADHQLNTRLWYGTLFGSVGILVIYNLFLAFALKNASYFYYVCYLSALALVCAINSGYSEQYLWPDYGGVGTRVLLTIVALAVIFTLLFCNHFLGVRQLFPRTWKVSLYIMLPVIPFALPELFGYTSGLNVFIVILISDITLIYYISVSIAAYRAGLKQARYILVAFSMYIGGYVIYQLYLFTVIGPHPLAVHAIEFGILVEAIMLSLALADRINMITRQKEIAEESVLKTQRDLSRRIIMAQEQDRESFANTLHDSIGHGLLVLRQGLDQMLGKQQPDSPDAKSVRNLVDYCADVLGDVRGLSRDLHPHVLRRLGLKAAVESTLERAMPSNGIEWVAEIRDTGDGLDSDVQLAIFRIIQEAINNIIKHAESSEVILSLHVNESHVAIDIKDDGIGFRVADGCNKGMGLSTMQGRAQLLGGNLTIESMLGMGTHIKIRIPI